MKNMLIIIATLVVSATACHAYDLEIEMRLLSNEIVFGDPLFMEVTVTNRSKEAIFAPRPWIDALEIELNLLDTYERLATTAPDNDAGRGAWTIDKSKVKEIRRGVARIRFDPGEAMKFYWFVFLPSTHQFDLPFWKHYRDNHKFAVWLSYPVEFFDNRTEQMVILRSRQQELTITERDERELKAILRAYDDLAPRTERAEGGPGSANLGFPLHIYTRKETRDLARIVKSGELADILQFTLLRQDVYHAAADAKAAAEARLIDKLRAQPDIKRQALARELATQTHEGLSEAALKSIRSLVGGP
jgi:hypothetical protein